MARIRTIKPEFPHSESMGRVSRESRLCFILLWTIADDAGRLRGNSRMLASLLYPYDDDAKNKIDTWLGQLSTEGCIARYEVDGTSYVQIMHWTDHQKIDKPSPSKLPAFVDSSRNLANVREASPLDQEGNGEEGKGDSAEPQSDSTPAVVSVPLVDKTEYGVTQAEVDEWSLAYPGVNVMQQLREMRAWSLANTAQRKTRRGFNAFVVRWLAKEQDKAGNTRPATFAQQAADIARTTVPAPSGRDPALVQLDADRAKAKPMTAEIRQALAQAAGRMTQ